MTEACSTRLMMLGILKVIEPLDAAFWMGCWLRLRSEHQDRTTTDVVDDADDAETAVQHERLFLGLS